MSPYYLRAGEEQQVRGDGTYLDAIQKMFAHDAQGGLIEVALSPDERLLYLYLAGQQIVVYHLTPTHAAECDADDAASRILPDSSIRYLKLPDEATRAVWQALSWYPPARGARLEAHSLSAYLDALGVERATGLLNVILPDADGFLFLLDGVPVRNETILASMQGFTDSLPGMHGMGRSREGSCEVWLSELRPGVPAADVTQLRLAFSAWVGQWLDGYQHLVGHSLLAPVNHAANTWLRHHRYNLRLVAGLLIDHHLFVTVETAVGAYRGLQDCLKDCLGQVIGDQLVDRIAGEALKRLKIPQQQILAQSGLAQPPL